MFSRREVGHEWVTSSAVKQPQLFGAGGEQDGSPALIQTNKNRQIEDEIALNGTGDRQIDENIYQRDLANANEEFNFSQFKHGATDGVQNLITGPLVSVRTTQGATAGDIYIKNDRSQAMVDVTSKALGDITGRLYKNQNPFYPKDGGAQIAVNPFASTETLNPDFESTERPIEEDTEAQFQDANDEDFYFYTPYYDEKAEGALKINANTGLRQLNTRQNSKRQLARATAKDAYIKTYTDAQENYAATLKDYYKVVSPEELKGQRDNLRVPESLFSSTQFGLSGASAKNYKKSRSQRMPSKLGGLLVGS